jgi:thiamine biosynthesis lipoprotein
MATTFRVVCVGVAPEVAREAARSAFARIDALECLLSRYRHGSDVQMINTAPAGQPVRVGPDCWTCLRAAFDVWQKTKGACDITVGSLVDWGKANAAPQAPPELVEQVGFQHLHLLPEYKAVVRGTDAVRVDLGALGKGYALDEAAAHLRADWEIGTFLLECGTSSSLFMVAEEDDWQWPVVIGDEGGPRRRVFLQAGSVSGSAAELKERHIVDPRTGVFLPARHRAWAMAPTAIFSDALSTAFSVLGRDEILEACAEFPGTGACLLRDGFLEQIGAFPAGEVIA